MRILSGILVLTFGLSVGCASTSSTTGVGGSTAVQARMTEADYDALMKKVGPTNGMMQKALKSGDLDSGGKSAQQLAMLFVDVERFWTQYKIKDAMMWAAEAQKYAKQAAAAAQAGDQMKAVEAATSLLGDCKQCHGTYRMGSQEAGFMIKPGVLGAE
jgi:cytochrome c556